MWSLTESQRLQKLFVLHFFGIFVYIVAFLSYSYFRSVNPSLACFQALCASVCLSVPLSLCVCYFVSMSVLLCLDVCVTLSRCLCLCVTLCLFVFLSVSLSVAVLWTVCPCLTAQQLCLSIWTNVLLKQIRQSETNVQCVSSAIIYV